MSTLFGHVRGSFTGALRDRPGLLRAADGGVLFLDEIGELGTDEQAMLLRAIEDKQFLPLGADREVRSDFQLIAGTNADLPAAVRRGRFREDLLARINLWTFRLPGLRERPEDIEPNLDHELANCAAVTGVRISMSQEARARFLAFATSAGGGLGGQLPRLQRGAGAHGHDRARRTDQPTRWSRRRSGGSARPGATHPGSPQRRSARGGDGAGDARRHRSLRPRPARGSGARLPRVAHALGCRPAAVRRVPDRGRPRPTTPTGSASTSRASAWNGVMCAKRLPGPEREGRASVLSQKSCWHRGRRCDLHNRSPTGGSPTLTSRGFRISSDGGSTTSVRATWMPFSPSDGRHRVDASNRTCPSRKTSNSGMAGWTGRPD